MSSKSGDFLTVQYDVIRSSKREQELCKCSDIQLKVDSSKQMWCKKIIFGNIKHDFLIVFFGVKVLSPYIFYELLIDTFILHHYLELNNI